MKSKLIIITLAGLSLVATTPAAAIVTSSLSDDPVVHAGEAAYGIDLGGVVMIGGLHSDGEPAAICSGALISDRHVISAAHCFDHQGDGVVDPELGIFPHEAVFETTSGYTAVTYELDSIAWPTAWPDNRADIAVIALTEDAPSWAPRYPLYAGDQEVGQPFVMAGFGYPGHGATGVDGAGDAVPTRRAGLNRYEAIRDDHEGVEFLAYDFDSGLEENNALAMIGVESDLGFGAEEVNAATRDSGGPTFIDGVITGVIAFGGRLPATDVTDTLDSSWGEASFDTRVSMFREFIEEATAGAAIFVTDTPHPGDYNGSGMVEQADLDLVLLHWGDELFNPYAVGWRNDLPRSPIDQKGLDNVLLNWGIAAATASTATVPEPSALPLALVVTCLAFFLCRPSTPLRVRRPAAGGRPS